MRITHHIFIFFIITHIIFYHIIVVVRIKASNEIPKQINNIINNQYS
jgi:hypothetical protein